MALYFQTKGLGIEGTQYKSLVGPDNVIYKRTPKLMRFQVRVPSNYLGDITFHMNNTHYDEEDVVVDICDLAVVETGVNIPCVHILNDVTVQRGPDSKVVGT